MSSVLRHVYCPKQDRRATNVPFAGWISSTPTVTHGERRQPPQPLANGLHLQRETVRPVSGTERSLMATF